MKIPDWKYYNHAAVPSIAPHEKPNLDPIKDGSVWSVDGKKPLFACYTTDWDCDYDTGWWYIIKDTPFDISLLKTKRRYEITKALRFFDIKEIRPTEYADSLADVQEQAFSAYPAKYRPIFSKGSFIKSLQNWNKQIESGSLKVFGAFFKETNELAGYSYIIINETYLNFAVQKTKPNYEKFNVNAALVYGVLESFKEKISKDYYICDGARSINHETRFQDYLEKYFGFRKAYCKLNTAYPPLSKFAITLLRPFQRFIDFLGHHFGLFHQISAILKIDGIARNSI